MRLGKNWRELLSWQRLRRKASRNHTHSKWLTEMVEDGETRNFDPAAYAKLVDALRFNREPELVAAPEKCQRSVVD